MKRIAIVALLGLLVVGSAAAQNANESELFVKTIYVEKVYPHQLGYMVSYVTTDLRLEQVFLPIEWFGVAAGRAKIIYGHDKAFPYMDVYWENGEFSHLRLYVKENLRDLSWGAIDQTEDYTDEFAVDTLELNL